MERGCGCGCCCCLLSTPGHVVAKEGNGEGGGGGTAPSMMRVACIVLPEELIPSTATICPGKRE